MKTCSCCGIEKDLYNFPIVSFKRGEKTYTYQLNKCRQCLNIDNRRRYIKKDRPTRYYKTIIKEETKKEEVNMKELKYLLRKIELRGGRIDEVDAYQLTHHYISVYGEYRRQFPNIQSEVLFYYNELLKIK